MRFYGLDQLRAILMLAGILFHASLVIGPGSWLYSSQNYSHDGIYYVVYVTHFFRMETFFLLSGFFSALVITRKGTNYFFDGRLKRVLVPLIASFLLVTSMQSYFRVTHGLMEISDIYNFERVISHTWFLLALFILSCVLVLLPQKFYRFFSTGFEFSWSKYNIILIFLGLVFLAFLPYGLQFISRVFIFDKTINTAISYLIIIPLKYLIYFALGWVIYLNDQIKNRLLKINKFLLFFLFVLSASILIYLQFLSISLDKTTLEILAFRVLPNLICSLAVSILLLQFFLSNNFRSSAATNFLVRSSLIVYFFHQPLLIAIAYYLDVPGLNVWIYFLLVCSLTYLFSFGIFLIIDKIGFLKKIFGGWASNKI